MQIKTLKPAYPEGIIENNQGIFILNTDDLSNSFSSPEIKKISRAASISQDTSLDGATMKTEVISVSSEIETCIKNLNKHISSKNWPPTIKWPYYKQIHETCWATTWLMLLKGYQKVLPDYFDSIYKILKFTEMPVDGLPQDYMINKISGYNTSDSFYFPLKTSYTIPSISKAIIGKNMKGFHLLTKEAFVAYIINQLDQGNPVMVNFWYHTVLFLGYKYTSMSKKDINNIASDIKFIFHNPSSKYTEPTTRIGTPYDEATINDLLKDINEPLKILLFIILRHYHQSKIQKRSKQFICQIFLLLKRLMVRNRETLLNLLKCMVMF